MTTFGPSMASLFIIFTKVKNFNDYTILFQQGLMRSDALALINW